MGKKKVTQPATASLKTSKNEKQLHRLVKVLRPKVYITDSSSFKQLVQELTGYQTRTTNIPEEVEKVPNMENIEIASTAMDSPFCMFDSFEQAFQPEVINQESALTEVADPDISMFNHVPLSTSQLQTNWIDYQNLESWLFDANDHKPSWHTGCSLIEPEAGLFDYIDCCMYSQM
ncbi:hypothetical protein ES319_D07G090900v1 [Gossypium barbadense]|uniref:VQ domain-containing protein n=1 Tax=Gossypium barbadense TaxID=3634 RepID=A0A5J5QS06_GOSBA|nr:hypothetical protein ES319_D07G090900v1 [Gossypium barbadense]PPD98724.1 hypothetical protein GOBAR_DD04250 [Gossypium barbadense]